MTGLRPRTIDAGGFLACALMIGYALYAEHRLLLEPCPLCEFQRMATGVLGLVFLLSALHAPSGLGRRVYAALVVLAGGAGIGIAAWHVRLQNLPADAVPACGPGFDYIMDAFPFTEALRMIFSGSGECATVDWQFLGLSMPAWVAICFAVLVAVGAWNHLRRLPA